MSILLTQDVGNIRVISLNRPDIRNALNLELRTALINAFKTAAIDKTVRVVILTGEGRAFCAGLDLNDLKTIHKKSEQENLADSKSLAELFELIYNLPKPVIAAINGHAIAGGAGLASVCDISIMSEDAKMGYTEARIGFVAALVSVFLLRQVGEKHARDLLLSARLISAKEAKTMNLVNEVVAKENLRMRALEIAKQISDNAPSSLSLTKSLISNLASLSLADGLEYAIGVNALSRNSDDLVEGVTAFLEKRPPNWQNKT